MTAQPECLAQADRGRLGEQLIRCAVKSEQLPLLGEQGAHHLLKRDQSTRGLIDHAGAKLYAEGYGLSAEWRVLALKPNDGAERCSSNVGLLERAGIKHLLGECPRFRSIEMNGRRTLVAVALHASEGDLVVPSQVDGGPFLAETATLSKRRDEVATATCCDALEEFLGPVLHVEVLART
jgi:hypothetical protein